MAWFKRLPQFMRTTLANKKKPIEDLVAQANAIVRQSQGGKQISVVHFDQVQAKTVKKSYNPQKRFSSYQQNCNSNLRRRQSNSKNQKQPGLCWYHRKFGAEAFKYRSPCHFAVSNSKYQVNTTTLAEKMLESKLFYVFNVITKL